MLLHGELAGGAAQRRRERRLRSWLRHERQTVAMVLAEACHHSSGSFPPTLKERRMAGQVAYEALRGQRTARTAGLHPDELVEPGVQGRLVAHSRPGCGGAPSPSLPHLAGGDTLDDTSVHFLLEMALLSPEEVEQLRQAEKRKLAREEKEKEEKKRREKERQELFARLTAEYLNSLSQSSSSTSQRRRKKRKKKKLPKGGCRLFPPCRGRPCYHRQVPAVQVVHVREGAPASVHRQIGGHSCFACRDVYPQCELCSSLKRFYRCCSWAVPPPDLGGVGFGSSPNLDTKLTIYELCLPSKRGCVALSCGGGFCSPDGAYDSVWDMVKSMSGKYFVIISSTKSSLGVYAC